MQKTVGCGVEREEGSERNAENSGVRRGERRVSRWVGEVREKGQKMGRRSCLSEEMHPVIGRKNGVRHGREHGSRESGYEKTCLRTCV